MPKHWVSIQRSVLCPGILYLLFVTLSASAGISTLSAGAADTCRINLNHSWKFRAADEMAFLQPAYEVSAWTPVNTGCSWEKQGHNSYGFSWYRLTVHITSALKESAIKEGLLYLHLGKIGDADMTYLNGKLLGRTGRFPPDYQSAAQSERVYAVRASAILWDQDNIIAIRVYADKAINSGLYEGACFLTLFNYMDHTSFVLKNTVLDGDFMSVVSYLNKSGRPVKGFFIYSVYNAGRQLVSQDTGHLTLLPGERHSLTYKTRVDSPDIFYTTWSFIDELRNIQLTADGYVSTLGVVRLDVQPPVVLRVQFQQKNGFDNALFTDQQLTGAEGGQLIKLLNSQLLSPENEKCVAAYFDQGGSSRNDLLKAASLLATGTDIWRYLHDERLKSLLDRIVFTIIQTQDERGRLYFSGRRIDPDDWEAGTSQVYAATLSAVISYYQATGYRPALRAACRFADLYITLVDSLINRPGSSGPVRLNKSFRGFLSPLVQLYQLTGRDQYFSYSKLLAAVYPNGESGTIRYQPELDEASEAGKTEVYRQLNDLGGLVKISRLTNEAGFGELAASLWDGLTRREDFVRALKQSAGPENQQLAWIRLSQQLFQLTGDLKYFNEIEGQLYAATPGSAETIALIPEFIVGTIDQKPIFMRYAAGKYQEHINTSNGSALDIQLICQSDFPQSGHVDIVLNPAHTASFSLVLRVPGWCRHYQARTVTKIYTQSAGQLLYIQRLWNAGDVVNIKFDLPASLVRSDHSPSFSSAGK